MPPNCEKLTPEQGEQSGLESFQICLDRLRKMEVRANRRALTHCAAFIKSHCQEDWQIEFNGQVGFFTNSAQKTLTVSADFGKLISNTIYHIENSNDRSVQFAISRLSKSFSPRQVISDIIVGLFLSHELLHIEQGLGSYQYRDADHYMQAVSLVDYQADIAAMDVLLCALFDDSDPVVLRASFYLMIVAHIKVMQYFSPSAELGEISMRAFERLLVWHFHAARVAQLKHLPDMNHPSLAQMPVISIPKLDYHYARMGKINSQSARSMLDNNPSDLRVDLVVAAFRGDGVAEISRETFTQADRMSLLVEALINEDFKGAREGFEEFLTNNKALLIFSMDDEDRGPISIMSETSLIGDRIIIKYISNKKRKSSISLLGDPEVISFFERIEYMIQEGMLNKPWWNRYGEFRTDGILNSIGVSLDDIGRYTLIMREVSRANTQLRLTLEKTLRTNNVVVN